MEKEVKLVYGAKRTVGIGTQIRVTREDKVGKVWFTVTDFPDGGTCQRPYGFVDLKELKKFARAILKL